MVAPVVPVVGAISRGAVTRLLFGNKGNDLLRDKVNSSIKGKIQGINLNVSANIKEVTRQLSRTQKRQIPFATSRALNDLVFDISRNKMPKFADKIFKGGATPFTKRGFKFTKSTKKTLSASVLIDKVQGSYMQFQVSGGTRFPKRKAILVPTNKIRLNKYGNLTRATYSRIINDKSKYFKGIPRGRFGEANEGIWERYGGNKNIRMVAKYTDKGEYRPLFPFGKITDRIVFARKDGFADRFNRRLKQALATAR